MVALVPSSVNMIQRLAERNYIRYTRFNKHPIRRQICNVTKFYEAKVVYLYIINLIDKLHILIYN